MDKNRKGAFQMEYSLEFDKENYTVKTVTLDGRSVTCRAYENIVYVKYPVDVQRQCLNIYVPQAFYEQETVNGHTLATVPVLLPNGIGGYAPAFPEQPGKDFGGHINATFEALCRGYVVATPGARGRGLKDADGRYYGCAPAGIVDLKAAVRYLRHNQGKVPGDVEKLISNGTSAGGAMSSLLGASGNHSDYEPYLKALGAADERDDIFAASCYCPITNLDHADMAYEWEFCGLNDYHTFKFDFPEGADHPTRTPLDAVMTKHQTAMSAELASKFPAYLNSLGLTDTDGFALTLDADGNGSFKSFIEKYVLASAQKELDQGTDLTDMKWLTVAGGKAQAMDFDGYVAYRTRMKCTPAFDNVSMGTPENELFGNADTQYRHFTQYSLEHSQVDGAMADADQIKLMNPMNYIGGDCDTAKHYRIRHGAIDRDTSLAISAMLTAKLRDNGVAVDYQLPWNTPHAGDYDLEELFGWIESIC